MWINTGGACASLFSFLLATIISLVFFRSNGKCNRFISQWDTRNFHFFSCSLLFMYSIWYLFSIHRRLRKKWQMFNCLLRITMHVCEAESYVAPFSWDVHIHVIDYIWAHKEFSVLVCFSTCKTFLPENETNFLQWKIVRKFVFFKSWHAPYAYQSRLNS